MTQDERMARSNSTLSEVVSSFNITEGEYALLTSLLYERHGNMASTGEYWLGPATLEPHVDSNKIQIKMLRLPLSDMPLYINSIELEECLIARWRLKIGR